MYTALATKADLAHQAQLFSERLERLRLEIRADRFGVFYQALCIESGHSRQWSRKTRQ